MDANLEGKGSQGLQVINGSESEFIDSTIRRIAQENAFGPGKLVSITSKARSANDEGNHFMSNVEFKIAIMVDEDGDQKEIPLIIKTQLTELVNLAEFVRSMFSNEINMFNDVLPLLRVQDIELFPRPFYCQFGASTCMDIVITEDLTKQQFHLLEQTVTKKDRMSFLVRKLGQFHGSCYRAKNRDPSVIDHLKNVLKPTKHFSPECGEEAEAPPFHKGLSLKIAEYLVHESEDLQRFVNNLKSSRDILADMRAPEEPFAAVVHGDLFNSNIFVRTCEDSQNIIDARFIDMQTSSYSDPVFDFSFLVFMSASAELLEQHWDDFVTDYWNGILSVEPVPGFSREDFRNNIERKALSGFMDACFFVPLTMTPREKLIAGPPSGPNGKVDIDMMLENHLKVAPAEAFNKLFRLLKFTVNKGFVKKALELFDE